MKRLCYVTTIPFTMKAFVVDTAVFLAQTGEFDATLVCSDDSDIRANLPHGVRFFALDIRRGIDLGAVVTVFRLWRLFMRERFDLVQYTSPNASLYASIAGLLAGIPVRIYQQGGFRYEGFSGLSRAVFKALERLTCAMSTQVEPVSRGALGFGLSERLYRPGKSKVIWNGSADGVDLRVFDYARRAEWAGEVRTLLEIPETSPVVGFVGRITRDKGVNELIEAFKVVVQSYPDARLLLVGDPENTESLDQGLWQWAAGESRVLVTGFREDTERLLAAMNVLALPSYREGFGSVIIEAQAMGLPVIVSDIPGPRDAVAPSVTALMVEPRDSAALASAIDRLLSDEQLASQMGANGRDFVARNFNQAVLMQHVLAERRKLLGIEST